MGGITGAQLARTNLIWVSRSGKSNNRGVWGKLGVCVWDKIHPKKLQGSKPPALIHRGGFGEHRGKRDETEGRGRCAAAQVRGGLRGAGSYLPDLVITISVPSL